MVVDEVAVAAEVVVAEVEVVAVDESPRRAAYGAAWVVLLDAIVDPARWID